MIGLNSSSVTFPSWRALNICDKMLFPLLLASTQIYSCLWALISSALMIYFPATLPMPQQNATISNLRITDAGMTVARRPTQQAPYSMDETTNVLSTALTAFTPCVYYLQRVALASVSALRYFLNHEISSRWKANEGITPLKRTGYKGAVGSCFIVHTTNIISSI